MINSFCNEFSFLSNFYTCQVEMDGLFYPSIEHAYQAAKTLDIDERETIRNTSSPGKAKRFGRKVTMRKDWDMIKINVMFDLLKKKFSDKSLADALVLTIPHELVEGNHWNDTFWGVCNGQGQNVLGKLLMKIREEIVCQRQFCI